MVRAGFRGSPAKAAMSSWPRKVLSHVAARSQQRGGAARAARLQRHGLADPGSSRLVRQLGTGGEEVKLGWPSYSGTVWLAPAGTAWHGGPTLAARGCHWGDPVMTAQFGRARQAPSSTMVPRQWRGGAATAAQLQWPSLASPGRRRPARQPSDRDKEALLVWPSNASTVWPAAAGTVQRSSTRRWQGGGMA